MILPEVEDLPEGWTCLGVAAIVKCWDERGEVRFLPRHSDSINEAEKRGMFDIGMELLAEDLAVEHITGPREETEDDGD